MRLPADTEEWTGHHYEKAVVERNNAHDRYEKVFDAKATGKKKERQDDLYAEYLRRENTCQNIANVLR